MIKDRTRADCEEVHVYADQVPDFACRSLVLYCHISIEAHEIAQ